MNKAAILSALSESRTVLRTQYNIARIGLFGSYASNAPRHNSDIDLVIELEEGKRLGFKESFELEKYLQEVLKTKRIDIVNLKYINPLIEHEMAQSVEYV
ncbi:MAG: nucleotidyltransferase domain-containing protein [Bacteroidota bacterium]